MLRPRNRELLALVPAGLLVTGGFAAIFIQSSKRLSDLSLTYGLAFLGLCVITHLAIRFVLPDADPYLFPLAAVLASFGLVIVYRISPTLARQQAQWYVLGLVLFAGTILFLRRHGLVVLERYRYTIATVGIAMLVLPRLPGIGEQVNGAYLNIKLGSIKFQPAELAKLAIVIFLASYLRDTRQILAGGGRRILGVEVPPMRITGPMLLIWGAAMGMLLLTRELGTSLMFFGVFVALLYVALGRVRFPVIGLLVIWWAGAYFISQHVGHVHERIQAWQHPFDPVLYNKVGGSYQLAQSLFAQADGGLLGTGFNESLLQLPNGHFILPVPESDFIYSVITNELGLAGATGLLLCYLLFVARGLKTAVLAPNSFAKLLAVGLSFIVALQVFVIVGGVTRVIPLTGVTMPFVAYGGSSVVMNFVLLGLLLAVSDRARREMASG